MGPSYCGKSTVALWLLARSPGPKVIVDPTGSAVTDVAGFYSTADPTGRSWPEGVVNVRFVPVSPPDLDAYGRLYATIREKILETRQWPQATVLADETETIFPVNRAPEAATTLVYSGRKWPTAHLACMTRPKTIALTLKANLTNAAIWALPGVADQKEIAAVLSIPLAELLRHMAALPPKGFLWWTQETRQLQPVHSSLA